MQSQVQVFTGTDYSNLTKVYWYRRFTPPHVVRSLSGPVDVQTPGTFTASTQEEYLIQISRYLGQAGAFAMSWGTQYVTNDYFWKPAFCGVGRAGLVGF